MYRIEIVGDLISPHLLFSSSRDRPLSIDRELGEWQHYRFGHHHHRRRDSDGAEHTRALASTVLDVYAANQVSEISQISLVERISPRHQRSFCTPVSRSRAPLRLLRLVAVRTWRWRQITRSSGCASRSGVSWASSPLYHSATGLRGWSRRCSSASAARSPHCRMRRAAAAVHVPRAKAMSVSLPSTACRSFFPGAIPSLPAHSSRLCCVQRMYRLLD